MSEARIQNMARVTKAVGTMLCDITEPHGHEIQAASFLHALIMTIEAMTPNPQERVVCAEIMAADFLQIMRTKAATSELRDIVT